MVDFNLNVQFNLKINYTGLVESNLEIISNNNPNIPPYCSECSNNIKLKGFEGFEEFKRNLEEFKRV